jgi:hypothetical protein
VSSPTRIFCSPDKPGGEPSAHRVTDEQASSTITGALGVTNCCKGHVGLQQAIRNQQSPSWFGECGFNAMASYSIRQGPTMGNSERPTPTPVVPRVVPLMLRNRSLRGQMRDLNEEPPIRETASVQVCPGEAFVEIRT